MKFTRADILRIRVSVQTHLEILSEALDSIDIKKYNAQKRKEIKQFEKLSFKLFKKAKGE